ncbi:MAG: septal ring lytic transglycosylase RlpA family protein [Synechococcus lacustris]
MRTRHFALVLGAAALACLPGARPVLAQEPTDALLQLTAMAQPLQLEDLEAPALDAPIPQAPRPAQKPAPRITATQRGEASWYGPGFFGNRTASGEVLRPGTLTAAHRTLPFGTKVRVTNLWNGRSAVVRINDRGPFSGARLIDLAHGAAQELGLVASGTAQVKLEVLQ